MVWPIPFVIKNFTANFIEPKSRDMSAYINTNSLIVLKNAGVAFADFCQVQPKGKSLYLKLM